MLKMSPVRTVAKWLILRQAATADRYQVATTQVVGIAVLIYNFKISFDAQRSVVVYGNFCSGHVGFFIKQM